MVFSLLSRFQATNLNSCDLRSYKEKELRLKCRPPFAEENVVKNRMCAGAQSKIIRHFGPSMSE